MQNKSRTRFLSALLASAMAFSQVSPTAAFAMSSSDVSTTQDDTEQLADTEGTKDAALEADTTAIESEANEDSAEVSVNAENKEDSASSDSSTAEEPDDESASAPATDEKAPSITEDAEIVVPSEDTSNQSTAAPENKAESEPSKAPQSQDYTITAVAVDQEGNILTDFTRNYGRRNPEISFKVDGLSPEDESALKDGSKTIDAILGFTPIVTCNAEEDSRPGDYEISIANAVTANPSGGTNTVVSSALHINRRPVTISVANNQSKMYGEQDTNINYDAVFSDNNSVIENLVMPKSESGAKILEKITVVTNRDPGEDAGVYTTHAEVVDSNTNVFYDVNVVEGQFTIEKAPLTINLNPATYVYGELPRAIAFDTEKDVKGFRRGDTWSSVFGDMMPSYAATKPGTDRDGMSDKRAPVGTYTVTGSIPEPTNYKIAPFTTTMEITKRPMLITVTPGQNKVYGEKDPTSLNVNFTNIGKVEGDFAGCVVSREPGEDVGFYKYDLTPFLKSADATNYNITIDEATKNGTNAFEIKKALLTITVPDATKVYGDENPTDLPVSFSGFVNNETIENLKGKLKVEHTATKTSNVGKYDIVFSGLSSDNYDIVWTNAEGSNSPDKGIGTLSITPKSILVKADPATAIRKYNELDNSVSFGYILRDVADTKNESVVDPENSPLVVSVACPEWNDVSAKAGTYPITVTVEDNPNYTVQTMNGAATVLSGNVAITPDQKVVTYGDQTLEEIEESLTFTAVSAQDGTHTYKNGETIRGIGTVNMNIVKDGVEAVANANGLLDAGTYDIMFTVTPISGKTCVFAGEEVPGETYDFIIDGKTSGIGRMVSNVRPVTFESKKGISKIYNNEDPIFNLGNANVGSFTGGSVLANPAVDLSNVVLTREAGENAGVYAFVGFDKTDAAPLWKNYNVSLKDNGFTIESRKVTGTIENKLKTYGDRFDDSAFSVVLDNFKNESEREAIEKSMSYVCIGGAEEASVGSYAITATFAKNPNYDLTIINGQMVVQKRNLEIDFQNYEKTYGDSDPKFEYVVTGNLNNNSKDTLQLTSGALTGDLVRDEGENVGSYAIHTTLYNDNYNIMYNGRNVENEPFAIPATGNREDVAFLTIKATPLSIIVNGGYKITYADKLPQFTVRYDGFKLGDNAENALTGTLTFVDDATGETFAERLDAGKYVVRAQGLENAATANYTISYVNGSLEVAPRNISVKPIANTKVYGSNDPEFAYEVTNGKEFVQDDIDLLNLVVIRDAGENVGEYTMKVQGEDKNFVIERDTAKFTITAKELTVGMAADTHRIYGDTNPQLTIDDLSFVGFVDNKELNIHDDKQCLDDKALNFVFVDGEGKNADEKSHACNNGSVKPEGLQNAGTDNYSFNYVSGNFIIDKRPITISAKPQTSVYGDKVVVDWTSHDAAMNEIVYTGNSEKPALVNGDENTLAGKNECAINAQSHAGTYEQAIVPAFTHKDYDITAIAGDYVVTKRPLTWNLRDSASVYGEKLGSNTIKNTLYRNSSVLENNATIVNGDNVEAVVQVYGEDHSYYDRVIMVPDKEGKTFLADHMERVYVTEDGKISAVKPIDINAFNYGQYNMSAHPNFGEDYDVTVLGNGSSDEKFVPKLNISSRVLDLTITQPKNFVYGDAENPKFEIDAVVKGEGIKEPNAIVNGDDLGLEIGVIYKPFDALENPEDDTDFSKENIDVLESKFVNKCEFESTGIRNAGEYFFKVYLNEDEATSEVKELLGGNYAVTVNYEVADKNSTSGVLKIARRPITVTLTPNPSEKDYGAETVLPELNYENFAFDDKFDPENAPEEIVSVKDSVQEHAGTVGLHKDVFQYKGGEFGNYKFSDAVGDLNIAPVALDEIPDVTIIGSIVTSDGTIIENVVPKDQFKDTWSVDDVLLVAPEGYEISASDSLDEYNIWTDMLVVNMPGKDVNSRFFLRNIKTGAISEMASKSVNIDYDAPVVQSVEVSTQNDIRNNEFSEFTGAIDVKLVGHEVVTRESALEDTIMPLFAGFFSSTATPTRAAAVSSCEADPNSGVAAVEYYTIPKTEAEFDAAGNLVIDASNFKAVDLTYSDPNNAHGTIKVSPDFVGYIVTRTKDNAGHYSAAAIATVSVIAPAALPSQDTNVPIRNNSKTGVGPVYVAGIAVAIGVATSLLVVVNKKKRKEDDK